MSDSMYEKANSSASSESLIDDEAGFTRHMPFYHRRCIPVRLAGFGRTHKAGATENGQRKYCFWSFFGKLFLTSFALWGILSLYMQSKSLNEHQPVNCDCGSTIAEAKQLGCKYDSMAAAWLPDICRDDELIAEFDRSGPGRNGEWYYWSDPQAQHLLTLEDMANLADTGELFYTTWDWHVAHCFGFFKKQIRGGFSAASLGTSDPYHHIIHCQEIVHGDRDKLVASGVGLNASSFT